MSARFPDGGPRLALGCMRLSKERERPKTPASPTSTDERAVAVLHAAFDAGITFLDTADAYCLDASEAGHNVFDPQAPRPAGRV